MSTHHPHHIAPLAHHAPKRGANRRYPLSTAQPGVAHHLVANASHGVAGLGNDLANWMATALVKVITVAPQAVKHPQAHWLMFAGILFVALWVASWMLNCGVRVLVWCDSQRAAGTAGRASS
jgi:hypothetical protein